MQTREKIFGLTCPNCGNTYEEELNTAIFWDTGDRELLLNNEFSQQICPNCGNEFILNYRFVYTDEDVKFMIINDPKFVDITHRIALRSSLSLLDRARKDEQEKYLTRMTENIDDLREKIIIFENYLSDKAIEIMKYILLESDELRFNHDDIEIFKFMPDGNYYIRTFSGEELELEFVKEVYDTIIEKYEGVFDEQGAEMIDQKRAYDFLKKHD